MDMQKNIREILVELGEDPDREGLVKTPERVDRSLRFLTRGYHQNLDEVVNGALFEAESDDMVIVRDIEFFSMCEHHMLPFFGKCHVDTGNHNVFCVGITEIYHIVNHGAFFAFDNALFVAYFNHGKEFTFCNGCYFLIRVNTEQEEKNARKKV